MDENRRGYPAGTKILGILGLFSGITFVIHLAIVTQLPNPTDLGTLSAYRTHSTLYTALWVSAAVWGAITVPFLAGVSQWLRAKSPEVSAASSAAMTMGIAVIVLAVVLSVGILQAIDATTASSSALASGPTEAAFWTNEMGTINAFGQVLFGIGFLLLGWLAVGRSRLPRWLGAAGVLAGVLGVVGVGIDPVTLGLYVVFVVWALYLGVRFLRSPDAGPDLE